MADGSKSGKKVGSDGHSLVIDPDEMSNQGITPSIRKSNKRWAIFEKGIKSGARNRV
jgi:hypothetical protein